MKILVIDDEEKIRSIVRLYLSKEGFVIEEAADGNAALEKIKRENFDLVIMDIMMPGMDGLTVCRKIREKSDLPIIMLTAREEEVDRILGLELGADDYVVKPFSPRELVARVKAILRRTAASGEYGNSDDAKDVVSYPGIEINPKTREIKVEGQPVRLTAKEFSLLLLMAKNYGRAFTRDELLQSVWGYDYYGDTRTVDTHVNRLRDKLASVPGCKNYINTVWGVGYKFEVRE
ncbi:MAG: response regulator transcription factor [Bacillota bacterium]